MNCTKRGIDAREGNDPLLSFPAHTLPPVKIATWRFIKGLNCHSYPLQPSCLWQLPSPLQARLGVDHYRQVGFEHHLHRIHHSFYYTSNNEPSIPRLLQGPLSWELTSSRNILTLGVKEPVSRQLRGKGFYSRYFLVPKKNGSWRLILDLRLLDSYVKAKRFKMMTLAAIIPLLELEEWFPAP